MKKINTKLEHYLHAKEKIESGEWFIGYSTFTEIYKCSLYRKNEVVLKVELTSEDGRKFTRSRPKYKDIHRASSFDIFTKDGKSLSNTHSQIRRGLDHIYVPTKKDGLKRVYFKKLFEILGINYEDLFYDENKLVFQRYSFNGNWSRVNNDIDLVWNETYCEIDDDRELNELQIGESTVKIVDMKVLEN